MLAMLGAVLGASLAHANLIQNGSFETASINPGNGFIFIAKGGTQIDNWVVMTTPPDGIDYVGGSFWQHADGSRSLDLNHDTMGGIQQTFPTSAGTSYLVTFWMAGNLLGGPTVKTMEVSAGGTTASYSFDITGLTTINMGWEKETFIFTASSSATTLSFLSTTTIPSGANWYGPALDMVDVEVVPLPPSIILMGFGLAAMAGYRKFRKN
jgi:choice-of-anchor C domain-containing protein